MTKDQFNKSRTTGIIDRPGHGSEITMGSKNALSTMLICLACCCATTSAGAEAVDAVVSEGNTFLQDPVYEQQLEERPPRGSTRDVRLRHTPVPPVIDGHLGDDVWALATETGEFWVIQQGRWPEEPTEILALTDADTLYFAFRVHDSKPDQVRAIETVRDRGLGFDDQVFVEMDAFMDHESVSVFSVNALGTQSDSIAGGRARRISWKGDWEAATARTRDGWTAEIAIPYEILNYRPDAEEFAVNFGRYHYRTRQWSWWADVTPQDKKEEMGRLSGVNVPARQGNTLTVMPFVFAGANVVDREGEFEDELYTAGVDVLYTPASNLTGVLSVNPDFTQVETQITDANFSYNEKAVRDPRVFFREGSDYLGNDLRIFYSPRVPDFDAGAKLFGQNGALRYGGFVTSSPDSRTDAVARLSLAPNRTHAASLMFVGSDRIDLRGSTVAVSASGREQVGTVWDVTAAFAESDAQSGQTASGAMYEARGGWQADYWSVGAHADSYDRDFIPVNSLVLDDRLGTQSWDTFVSYYRDLGDHIVSERNFDVVYTDRQTEDGRTQYEGWYVGSSLEWNAFVRTGIAYTDGDFRPVTGIAPGEFSDQINHDRFWTASVDFNTRSSQVGYGVSYSSGDLGGGEYEYLIGYLWARPTQNTNFQVTAERLDSFGTFTQYVTEAGWDITRMNSVVFRHIYAEGDEYWRLGYRRVVRSGLDVFLLYDEEPGHDAAVSAKLLWTMF
jgi:hypothetical protein